jgi:hypothetical protein
VEDKELNAKEAYAEAVEEGDEGEVVSNRLDWEAEAESIDTARGEGLGAEAELDAAAAEAVAEAAEEEVAEAVEAEGSKRAEQSPTKEMPPPCNASNKASFHCSASACEERSSTSVKIHMNDNQSTSEQANLSLCFEFIHT